jgi:hypothetical protein
MPAMREAWTDERLDDLNAKVDSGFGRMDERFAEVDARFERVDLRFTNVEARLDGLDGRFGKLEDRIDALNRTLFQGTLAIAIALLGIVATQL